MARTSKRPRFANLRAFIHELGDIPLERVCFDPLPGTATKRDLLRLHGRDNKLYELIDRTLVEKPMGSPESFLEAELIRIFGRYLDGNDIGYLYAPDALVELVPGLVRGPDVCFTSWDKRPGRTVSLKPISDLIPDLVVEVLSPTNTRGEIERKLREYFWAGVSVVWVIDPRTRSADVHTAPDEMTTLDESGTLDGGDVLPGFRLPLAKLFERLEKPAAKKPRKKK